MPERPSKTGRQLQSVAKQFGSIGKTASDITNRNINVQMIDQVLKHINDQSINAPICSGEQENQEESRQHHTASQV